MIITKRRNSLFFLRKRDRSCIKKPECVHSEQIVARTRQKVIDSISDDSETGLMLACLLMFVLVSIFSKILIALQYT